MRGFCPSPSNTSPSLFPLERGKGRKRERMGQKVTEPSKIKKFDIVKIPSQGHSLWLVRPVPLCPGEWYVCGHNNMRLGYPERLGKGPREVDGDYPPYCFLNPLLPEGEGYFTILREAKGGELDLSCF